MKNAELAFVLGRVTLGINFAAHGLVRLPKLGGFAQWMVGEFRGTLIGFEGFIHTFALILPFVELMLGVLLILGLRTRATLIGSFAWMACLIFGASMQENWPAVGFQMVYVVLLFLLVNGQVPTRFSLDSD